MRPKGLKSERLRRGWGQEEASRRLGVSQPYLTMLENHKRRLTPALARKFARVYGLSPLSLPLPEPFAPGRNLDAQRLAGQLGRLEYPGFAYLHSKGAKMNPAEFLLTALAQENLDARVAEALPWLLLKYWTMDFGWLVEQAKRLDLQNRLGFLVNLARQVSEKRAESNRTRALSDLEATLERSRLAREETFLRPPRSQMEEEWLRRSRPPEARHWNLLTDLRPEYLQYVAP